MIMDFDLFLLFSDHLICLCRDTAHLRSADRIRITVLRDLSLHFCQYTIRNATGWLQRVQVEGHLSSSLSWKLWWLRILKYVSLLVWVLFEHLARPGGLYIFILRTVFWDAFEDLSFDVGLSADPLAILTRLASIHCVNKICKSFI